MRSQHQTAGYSTHFWLECRWIPVKALLDRLLTLLLVFNVIVAVVTVAIVAKLSVGKTFAISVKGHFAHGWEQNILANKGCLTILDTLTLCSCRVFEA